MSTSSWRTYAREYSRSKSGVAGIIFLAVLLAASAYSLVEVSPNEPAAWYNPEAWAANPSAVPPTWVSYLGVNAPPSLLLSVGNWTAGSISSSTYSYTGSASFSWSNEKTPSGFALTPVFTGTAVEALIDWQKPDGDSLKIALAAPDSGTSYDLTDATVKEYIGAYLESQTSTLLSSVTPTQELSALFGADGQSILTNPVLQGQYKVTVEIVSGTQQAPGSPSAVVSLPGDSYGSMGTDIYGRPIALGILAGLPSALELGLITSIVAVLVGVLFGGLSGFYGGWRDGFFQWGTLVVLALPALPFLVALSYSVNLSLISEGLLIAALSWPFYAIIARSVSLSIRSQTYVEADRAMGVSSVRSFLSHFLPRLVPVSIAYTALGVPAGIILSQTLAFLGIQPENLITWGGMLDDAFTYQAALYGWWWWILIPGLTIIAISVPFVLIGFALDRIVAPRVSAR